MQNSSSLLTENMDYWAGRAAGYSELNREELAGESRSMWKKVLKESVAAHMPDRPAERIRALDIGTGPGFIAILLAELGLRVTAVDLSEEMLALAKQNAAENDSDIRFAAADAQILPFKDESFDLIVCRNLTWNLRDPVAAYREWRRVLRPEGLLLVFDANWYRYLYDEEALAGYRKDRELSAAFGLGDQNVGTGFDRMERIARSMPLSKEIRPAWDLEILQRLRFRAEADPQIWRQVWTRQEQINFSSTPMFLIRAVPSYEI